MVTKASCLCLVFLSCRVAKTLRDLMVQSLDAEVLVAVPRITWGLLLVRLVRARRFFGCPAMSGLKEWCAKTGKPYNKPYVGICRRRKT